MVKSQNKELEKLAETAGFTNGSPVAGYNGLIDTKRGNYVHTLERGLHKPSRPNQQLSRGANGPESNLPTARPNRQPKVKLVGARKPLTPQSMSGE